MSYPLLFPHNLMLKILGSDVKFSCVDDEGLHQDKKSLQHIMVQSTSGSGAIKGKGEVCLPWSWHSLLC